MYGEMPSRQTSTGIRTPANLSRALTVASTIPVVPEFFCCSFGGHARKPCIGEKYFGCQGPEGFRGCRALRRHEARRGGIEHGSIQRHHANPQSRARPGGFAV